MTEHWKIRYIIDGLIGNKEMFVMIVAFAAALIVVYFIRRLSVDYAWTIAMVTGALLDVMILLFGDLMYNTNLSIIGLIIGSIASVLLAKIFEFFVFNVDYSRTEYVQFEDDEYYYYVKAVPKNAVSAPQKRVKTIRVPEKAVGQTEEGWIKMSMILEHFNSYIDTLSLRSLNIRWEDIVEVIIISFLLYEIMAWVKHTKVWLLMKGIIIIIAFILLALIFKMHTIIWIVENVLSIAVTAVIVICSQSCDMHLRNLGGKVLSQILFPLKSRQMSAFLIRLSMTW